MGSTFGFEGKSFVMNGKPTFVFGGEFHYFRCPRNRWREQLQKIKDAGCNVVSTYIPWIWHESDEGVIDLHGKTREEKDLEGFLELVDEIGLYCIVRPGPYVMAETVNSGIPSWLLENYPQVIGRDKNGKNHPSEVITYLHPTFLEKVRTWYDAVNDVIARHQITRGKSIIMYQLCNEVGMFHWVTNTPDYSDSMLKSFADYLIEKYGSLEAIEEYYGTQYDKIEEFLRDFVQEKSQNGALRFHYDWGMFFREYIKKYILTLKMYAQESGIDVPFITNVHGFKNFWLSSRGMEYPIGLSQLYNAAQIEDMIVSGDFYPGHVTYDSYHDLFLSCAFTAAISNAKQPIFSVEFQSGRSTDKPRISPNDVDLSTRTCIANGMNAINYYMFTSGENYEGIGLFGRRHDWQAPVDFDGNLRPHYFKIMHLGKMLKLFNDQLLRAKKEIKTHIAFYPDYYMTDVQRGNTRETLGEMISERDNFSYDGILRLLTVANIPYDAIDILKEETIDVTKVPTLWTFSTRWMDERVQKKLLKYVEDGGTLVLFPTIPQMTLSGEQCRILADAFGIEEFDEKHGWQNVDILDIDDVFVNKRVIIHKKIGEPIAWKDSNGQREYAGFIIERGLGKFMFLGIGMVHEFNYELEVIKALARKIGIEPIVSLDDDNLSVAIRSDKATKFIFINNYDEIDRTSTILYNGEQLFDGQKLTIPARTGVMLPVNCKLNDDIHIVYSTTEIYDVQEDGRSMSLFLKMMTGEEATVVLHTKTYVPVNNDSVQITLYDDTYFIKVTHKVGESVTLEFQKKL